MTTANQIRAFIIENFLFGDTSHNLAEDISLIETDLVDSTAILELVAFVEETYGIAVADADIVPANFDSIGRISAFVETKLAVTKAA